MNKIKEKVLKDLNIEGFLESVCSDCETEKSEKAFFEDVIKQTLAEVLSKVCNKCKEELKDEM